MLLLSWNVNFRKPAGLVAKIDSVRPDIVTLQEVTSNRVDDWGDRLADIGLVHACCSGKDAPPTAIRKLPSDITVEHANDSGENAPPVRRWKRKGYQCLIASRWPVTGHGNERWRRTAPYPEMLGRAAVAAPEGDIDLFTVHIPNGSNNGWRKIDTFNVLSAALRRGGDSPRILTGDFNEPKRFRRSGQIVPFGEKIHKDGGTSTRGWYTKFGDRRRRIERTNGVRSVLDGASRHGLRDAYRDLHGFAAATPVTYYTTHGNPRCFDHTFVSRHFDVLTCGYFHEWREQGLSDHSPMWTNLRLSPDQPELVEWEGDRPEAQRQPGGK